MWTRITNIWFKELMDSLRDRRALRQAILTPVAIGILYAIMNPLIFAGIERQVERQSQESLIVPTLGSENIDAGLAAILDEADIILEEYSGTRAALEAEVTEGDLKTALVIPADFAATVAAEGVADLELLVNTGGSAFDIDTSAVRLRSVIDGYGQLLVSQRLAARGVDPSILTPIELTQVSLTTPEQAANQLSGLYLPILIAIVVVQGGMFVAIDVTAGEKERGTLESLLVTPSTDLEIFLGKLLAVFTTTLIPLVLTFVAFGLSTNLLPASLSEGATIPISTLVGSIVIAIPLAIVANILLMILAIRTKTFKDAQSAVTPFTFLIIFPMMAAGFFPSDNPLVAAIPVYGTGTVAAQLGTGNTFPWLMFALSVVGCAVLAVIAFIIAMRLFDRERLLYSM